LEIATDARRPMKYLAGKLSVGYLVLCEGLAGAWLALYVAVRPDGSSARWMSVGIPVLLMTICLVTGVGLMFRRRWAWFASLGLGLATLGMGVFFMAASMRHNFYVRDEREFLLGTGAYFVVPSLCGLVLLFLPDTRRYVLNKRKRIRKRRQVDVYGRDQV
jgi:hypothetical protein